MIEAENMNPSVLFCFVRLCYRKQNTAQKHMLKAHT